MLSASFAAVPFYSWFCKVTGYGGTPISYSEAYQGKVFDHQIKVRFDASKAKGMPWDFTPLQEEININLGETALIFYEAYNPTNKPVSGQASFNIFPFSAGNYFSKIDCFCFIEQTLKPGERVKMPVTFYIDPEMINNVETKDLKALTLSYTFYRLEDKLES
jgi:cytochrome c oxidase assembly protein subunit 11